MSRFIFGPVASRRLGISLGVDLVPHKRCSLNCVYCEAGETDMLSNAREELIDAGAVIAELEHLLRSRPKLDFITFSGAGEPTLNTGIGKIVDFLKEHYAQYKICLLTNATTFGDADLIAKIRKIDLIVPSLDATDEEEFQKINRPAAGLHFAPFYQNLLAFCRSALPGQVILELFIVPGVNDSDASIKRFREMVAELGVSRVQLNTLDRPGCVDWIKPSSPENTMRFVRALQDIVEVEAVGPFRYKSVPGNMISEEELGNLIIQLVVRRPATRDDLVIASGVPLPLLEKVLGRLTADGIVGMREEKRGTFYFATDCGSGRHR